MQTNRAGIYLGLCLDIPDQVREHNAVKHHCNPIATTHIDLPLYRAYEYTCVGTRAVAKLIFGNEYFISAGNLGHKIAPVDSVCT